MKYLKVMVKLINKMRQCNHTISQIPNLAIGRSRGAPSANWIGCKDLSSGDYDLRRGLGGMAPSLERIDLSFSLSTLTWIGLVCSSKDGGMGGRDADRIRIDQFLLQF